MSWPKEDIFAVTLDGKVLLNARALDGVDLGELAKKKNIFVGVVLTKREVRSLSESFYDASSEAAAVIVGARRKKKLNKKKK